VKDKIDIAFAFSAFTLSVWQQEGHPACKTSCFSNHGLIVVISGINKPVEEITENPKLKMLFLSVYLFLYLYLMANSQADVG